MNNFLSYSCLRSVVAASVCLACALPCAADYYVAQNGQTPAGPYTSWATAASNIQDAVNVAANDSTVWVGAGRYTVTANTTNYWGSNVVFINRPLSLRSSNGVPETTVIDGQGKHRGLTWYYTTACTSLFLLDGFTITNCWATNVGGGIFFAPTPANYALTAAVQNCVISDNIASSRDATGNAAGGGIYTLSYDGFGLTVSNCVIRNNIATNVTTGQVSTAGGMYLYSYGKKHITGCLVENNRSMAYGGGMYAVSSDLLIENSIFRENRNVNWDYNYGGGAMYLSAGVVTLRSCLIYNNYSSHGAGIYKFASAYLPPEQYGLLDIHNCTIVSNINYGIYERRADKLNISNSILYTNTVASVYVAAGPIIFYATNSWIYYNSVTGGTVVDGVGNITNGIDPEFNNSAGNNYRLKQSSPCFNAGTNQEWMANATDLDGRKRIRYGCVDMGAYEILKDATVYRFK